MTLERQLGIIINLKKIRLLMKKNRVVLPNQESKSIQTYAKSIGTKSYYENILNRKFYEANPGEYLLTDITYIIYDPNRNKAYLSTIKDATTREILAYKLSQTLDVEYVLGTVNQLFQKHSKLVINNTLIHSDLGCRYTSFIYQQSLKYLEITQSMSRRGNCWDNTPQESFFGHMKDELKIKECLSFDELQVEIDDYMDYFNNYRYQWDLEKRSPVEYRIYLFDVAICYYIKRN